MRQNPEFIISPLADKYILVPTGKQIADFNAVISVNKLGAEIWEMLGNDCSEDDILNKVLQKYDVTESRAKADIKAFLDKLHQNGCIVD